MRPEDTEMIANICSFERMEAAINEFATIQSSTIFSTIQSLIEDFKSSFFLARSQIITVEIARTSTPFFVLIANKINIIS